MKKYTSTLFIIFLSCVAYAQDLVIKGTKPVSKQYTPQQVIDSLERQFPNAKSVKYYKAPADVTEKGWEVTTEDNLADASVEYYTISFKQNGLQYYGLYAPDGTLLECKIQHDGTDLPEAVVSSLKGIAKDYPGYKVASKTYFKTVNYSKSKEYYEITATDGKQKKLFVYSPSGDLLKVKS
jgi:hypothetical protein